MAFHQFQFDPSTGAAQPVQGDVHAPFTDFQADQWDPSSPAVDPHEFPTFAADLQGTDPTFAPNIHADGGPLHRAHDDSDDDCGDPDGPDVDDCDPSDTDDERYTHGLSTAGRPPYFIGRSIHGGGPGPFSRSRGLQ